VDIFKSVIGRVWSRFGYCPTCIREVFINAVGACSITSFTTLVGWNQLLPAAVFISDILTFLWLIHLRDSAGRASIAYKTSSVRPNLARRAVLPYFVRAAAAAAFASA